MRDPLGQLSAAIAAEPGPVTVVGLDGRSGVGKSTLAAELGRCLPDCRVLDGDDFYVGLEGDADWKEMAVERKVARVFDWRRQHRVLYQLRAGRSARWQPYDWHVGDGRLAAESVTAAPASVVVLDGVYSGRPELASVVDLGVLVTADEGERHRRLAQREGVGYRDEWFERWSEVEQHYFSQIMPAVAFDLIVRV